MNDAKPWPLPSMPPDRLPTAIDWQGFVGVDTIDGISERITRIVAPGRTFTLVNQDRDLNRGAEIRQGLTLYMGESYQKPIRTSVGEFGGGINVSMTPGINGFGVLFDRDWDTSERPPWPMTSEQVRDRVYGHGRRADRFDWSWISISGGIDGPRPGLDRITIRKCNEHGYKELIQVIPGDIAWQQRHERDALTAEQLADALGKDDPDEYDPGAGIAREDAQIAARALRQMAANLRRSREPLTAHEVFPVVTHHF